MSEHLARLALVVVLSHGFRSFSARVGPRWGGLALGLPCSTAIALVGSGSDQGIDYARAMAETSLLGLAGAVALPLGYARALSLRQPWPWPPIVAVVTYLTAVALAGALAPSGSGLGLMAALVAVLAATTVAGRIEIPEAGRRVRIALGHPLRTWLFRTTIPAACLTASLLLGRAFGPAVAGLTSTFPALTLTVLLLTHLEAGAGAAVRMARTLPPANLGMVAFLGVFRWGIVPFGLAAGTALAYLAALVTLALVAGLAEGRGGRLPRWRDWVGSRTIERPIWPRSGRRFAPFVEFLAA